MGQDWKDTKSAARNCQSGGLVLPNVPEGTGGTVSPSKSKYLVMPLEIQCSRPLQ